MPGGGVALAATADVNRVEAPVTWKTYLMCAFASFGGIFFGYDSGYINGVNGDNYFIHAVQPNTPLSYSNPLDTPALTGPHQSLITSILSCGTFFGALIAGDLADFIGRKWTIIIGCGIYIVGKFGIAYPFELYKTRLLTLIFQVSFSKSLNPMVSVSSLPVA